MWADLSIFLALALGVVTAVPGLLVAQAGYALALTGIVWRGP